MLRSKTAKIAVSSAAALMLIGAGGGYWYSTFLAGQQIMDCFGPDGARFTFVTKDSRRTTGTPGEGECSVVWDGDGWRRRVCDAGDSVATCRRRPTGAASAKGRWKILAAGDANASSASAIGNDVTTVDAMNSAR